MKANRLAIRAQRVSIRTAGIAGAGLIEEGGRIFLIVGSFGFWNSAALLAEVGLNSFLTGLGVALALEIREIEWLQDRPIARWMVLAVASTVAVLVSCIHFAGIDISLTLGLAASLHSLWLHRLWRNGAVALVAIAYLTRRRESVQAQQRRHLMELRLTQTRGYLASISAEAAEARLDPQMLFDCLTRARDVYPVDMRRGDALLDNLVQYLRMTLRVRSGSSSTLAQAASLAAARVDVERRDSDAPMNLQVEPEVGNKRFPADLLAPLACEWLRHPTAKSPRELSLNATTDAKSLRVWLRGPCPVPAGVLLRATGSLIAYAADRATITAHEDSIYMEIAHA